MKNWVFAVCAALSAALAYGKETNLADAQFDFERTATEGAAQIVLREFADRLLSAPPEDGWLQQQMLEAPERNVKAEESRRYCAEEYRKLLERRYREGASNVLARLSRETKSGNRISGDFAERALALSAGKIEAAAQQAVGKQFAAERAKAAARQSQTIIAGIRPSESEVENVPDAELARRITARIVASQQSPVFEENVEYVNVKIVRPMLESAQRERGRQREYVERLRPDAESPKLLGDELRRRLAKNIETRTAEAGECRWREFPSVTNRTVRETVDRRILRKFCTCIAETPFAVTAAEVAEAMRRNPAAHVRKAESRKAIRDAFASNLVVRAQEWRLQAVPETERADLAGYLSERLAQRPDAVAKAARARADREVTPVFEQARTELSRREMSEVWPELANRTWLPEQDFADRTLSRGDSRRAVKDWRKDPELAELAQAPSGRLLLEETERAADAAVAHGFETARSAIAVQNGELDTVFPSVRNEAVADHSSWFAKSPDAKTLADKMRKLVLDGWMGKRETVLWPEGAARPADAESRYVRLFPSVEKRIELLARTIMEQLERPEPSEPEPVPTVEENEPESVSCTIELERKGDRVEVRVKNGDAVVFEDGGKAKLPEFEAVMRKAARKAGTELLNLR